MILLNFYSRASARRDKARPAALAGLTHFYSRASARRDPDSPSAAQLPNICLLTRLCEARPYRGLVFLVFLRISTPAPLRGAPGVLSSIVGLLPISTHAPLARCDASRADSGVIVPTFLLTHLLRGATLVNIFLCYGKEFLLTHLLRGATRCNSHALLRKYFYSRTSCEVRPFQTAGANIHLRISTHAPLARCDTMTTAPAVIS